MDAAWLILCVLALCVGLWGWEQWAELRDTRRALDALQDTIDEQQELIDEYRKVVKL